MVFVGVRKVEFQTLKRMIPKQKIQNTQKRVQSSDSLLFWARDSLSIRGSTQDRKRSKKPQLHQNADFFKTFVFNDFGSWPPYLSPLPPYQ